MENIAVKTVNFQISDVWKPSVHETSFVESTFSHLLNNEDLVPSNRQVLILKTVGL